MKRERRQLTKKHAAERLKRDWETEGRLNVTIHREGDKWIVSCDQGYVPPERLSPYRSRGLEAHDELGLLENIEE